MKVLTLKTKDKVMEYKNGTSAVQLETFDSI